MWRNYHRIMQAAIARSNHEPNPSKTGKAYRHFAVVADKVGFNSTPVSRNSIKARHCHAEQDVLRKLSPGKYDSLFVGRLASDFSEENPKFGNSKPCIECVDRIKNAKNNGIFIKKVFWTNSDGTIESCSVDNLESDHLTLHQRTHLLESSSCCSHENHHHHHEDEDDEEEEEDDDEAKREKNIKNDDDIDISNYSEYNQSRIEQNHIPEYPDNDPNKSSRYKVLLVLGASMLVPYFAMITIIDSF